MLLRRVVFQSNNFKKGKTIEDVPTRSKVYPDLKDVIGIGKGPIRRMVMLLLFLFTGAIGIAYAQSNDNSNALKAYMQLFEETNVGNLHVYSLSGDAESTPDDFFYGERIPRGLYGLFAANWRDELPDDFEAHALFKIKHGSGDAYLMRFAGPGTQNLIGLFSVQGEKIVFMKILSSHVCTTGTCWQTDSWIQDFDGDTRLDILQKVRVLQYTLLNAPVEEYVQLLLQEEDGSFIIKKNVDIDTADYQFAEDKQTK